MSNKKIAVLAIFTAALLGSAAAGVSKKGLEEMPPFSLSFFRLLIASILVLPLFIKFKDHKFKQMKKLSLISLFATGNILFFILGVYFSTANIGSIIYAAVPLLAAVILYIFFKETISAKKQFGIFIGFLGATFITLLPVLERSNPFSGNILGNIFLVLAITCWGFYSVFTKKLQDQYSPFIITCNFIFISTLVLFPFFVWDTVNNFGWWNNLGFWGIFSVFYLSVIVTILNYTIIQYAIKYGGPVIAGTIFYVMPILGFGINFLLLGELLTPAFIFGSILALMGTYLVVRK